MRFHRLISSSTARSSIEGAVEFSHKKAANGRDIPCVLAAKGATSTSPSWAPGIKKPGVLFYAHSDADVTDNGAGRGIGFIR
jgi:hypothetical protein